MPQPPEALKLRQELKEWERAFANAHEGRKPTRDEIKKDVKIAAKYTEYYKLQPSSKSKSKPSRKPSTESSQSKPAPAQTSTRSPAAPSELDNPFASRSTSRPSSSKSTKRPTNDDVFKTPSKPYNGNDLYDSPLSTRGRRLFGNRLRETVGPTPQKIGKVLGIFDSFVDVETTPTHQRVLQSTPTTGNRCTSSGGRVSASPAERGDAFTTPRKRKVGELSTIIGSGSEGDSPSKPTPKDAFSTPSFLRRDSGRFTGSFVDSPPVPLPMRPLVRGLSSIVAELRKMEDDAYNDEEEAIREMEGGDSLPSGPAVKKIKSAEHDVVVELENNPDTGLPPPPEGAWKEEERVEEQESGDEKEDKTRKWKKKGLKRQHRRVIMRPVAKNSHAPDEEAPPNPEEVELPGAGYSDEDLSDLDNEPEPQLKDPRKKAKPTGQDTGVAEKPKRAARKVSEKAHTNYKKLNIRGSKGAKAGNGGGRFSRKRR